MYLYNEHVLDLASSLQVKVNMLRDLFLVSSLSQVAFTLMDLFHKITYLRENTKVLVYDDGCHLYGFIHLPERAIAWAGQAAWVCMMALFICVDRFHIKNHVDKWCLEHMPADRPEMAHLMKGEPDKEGKPSWSVNTQVMHCAPYAL